MILKISMKLIKEIGLNPAVLYTYFLKVKRKYEMENIIYVKLKEVEKEICIKRTALKTAIEVLKDKKFIKIKMIKVGIITNVRISFLRSENQENHGVENYIYTASKPLKFDVENYVTTAAFTVSKTTSTPHKHTAPSIYPVFNKLNTLKKSKNPAGFCESFDVRKNLKNLVSKSYGKDHKKKESPSMQKQVNLSLKDKTNTKASTTLSEREKELITAQEILKHLNQKSGKNFNVNAHGDLVDIRARLKEGYKFNQFIKVIDKKSSDWKDLVFSNGKSANLYLRPQTLFSSKNFSNYINEEPSEKSNVVFKNSLEKDLYNFFMKNDCQPS